MYTKYSGEYFQVMTAVIILDMDSANERWRYIVTSSLICWARTQNDPWWPENDIRTCVNDVLKQKKYLWWMKQLTFGGDNNSVNAHNETYFHKRIFVFMAIRFIWDFYHHLGYFSSTTPGI